MTHPVCIIHLCCVREISCLVRVIRNLLRVVFARVRIYRLWFSILKVFFSYLRRVSSSDSFLTLLFLGQETFFLPNIFLACFLSALVAYDKFIFLFMSFLSKVTQKGSRLFLFWSYTFFVFRGLCVICICRAFLDCEFKVDILVVTERFQVW